LKRNLFKKLQDNLLIQQCNVRSLNFLFSFSC